MALGEESLDNSRSRCRFLALPFEIRTRIYRCYFTNPVVAIWFDGEGAESLLGLRTDIDRLPEEIAYRRAISDDYDEGDYAYKSHRGDQTVGWLEDYRPLFGTCQQICEEARDILGPMIHLKLLSFGGASRSFPNSLRRLYFPKIQQLTVMCGNPIKTCSEPCCKVMCLTVAEELPNLKCVRLLLPECIREWVPVQVPSTVEELAAGFAGNYDMMLIEHSRNKLMEPGHIDQDDTIWWCDWMRDIIFKRKAHPFRVLRREIFDVCTTEWGEDEEEVYSYARHFVKLILEHDAITSEVTRRRLMGVSSQNGRVFSRCPRYRWRVLALENQDQLTDFIEGQVWPALKMGDVEESSSDDEMDGGPYEYFGDTQR